METLHAVIEKNIPRGTVIFKKSSFILASLFVSPFVITSIALVIGFIFFGNLFVFPILFIVHSDLNIVWALAWFIASVFVFMAWRYKKNRLEKSILIFYVSALLFVLLATLVYIGWCLVTGRD